MEILIIEDEQEAVGRLQMMMSRYDSALKTLHVLDSVSDAIVWFRSNRAPDLIFLDIHLADGLSFEIFNHVEVRAPIIFTTAYDEYALHAFKAHSIAYLLKPFSYTDFKAALDKLAEQRRILAHAAANSTQQTHSVLHDVHASVRTMTKRYKTRFLLQTGETIHLIPSENIRYFVADGKIVTLTTVDGRRHIADNTLEELESLLDPALFFRVSRQYIVHIDSISTLEPYFNGRLLLKLQPPLHLSAQSSVSGGDVLVSRERVRLFKEWLEST